MLLKHQTTGASLNWDGSRMLSACPCTHLWVSVYNRGVCKWSFDWEQLAPHVWAKIKNHYLRKWRTHTRVHTRHLASVLLPEKNLSHFPLLFSFSARLSLSESFSRPFAPPSLLLFLRQSLWSPLLISMQVCQAAESLAKTRLVLHADDSPQDAL